VAYSLAIIEFFVVISFRIISNPVRIFVRVSMTKKTQKVKTRFDDVYKREIQNKRFRNKSDIAFEVVYQDQRKA